MPDTWNALYQRYAASLQALSVDDGAFRELTERIRRGENSFALTRKRVEKEIDLQWVEAIEGGIVPIDNFIRNPRKFIKQEEEILPIELSHNITAESVRHLAQHTNLISKVEGDTVTPSKILNVYKEESLETYENKFVNTLIDRLYLFIGKRYAQLREAASDEEVILYEYKADWRLSEGESLLIRLTLENHRAVPSVHEDVSGLSVWERVERLYKIIMDFKGSVFVQDMKGAMIRPPVMRTNAIMKNQDLKQCLLLWQFVEGYDKVGYSLREEETAEQTPAGCVEDTCRLAAVDYLMLRAYTGSRTEEAPEVFKTRRASKAISPKFVKSFVKQMVDSYDFREVEFQKVLHPDLLKQKHRRSADEIRIKKAVDAALVWEKKRKALELARLREEEKQRRLREQSRIAREKERQRLQEEREKEKERLRIAREEARERQRAEQEKAAAERLRRQQEREAARLEKLREQERLAEQRRLEEEERLRAESLARALERKQAAMEAARRVRQPSRNGWKTGRR